MTELKKVIDWTFISLIPLTLLNLAFGILSDSLTIYAIFFDSGLSIVSHLFAFVSIRLILKENVFQYPYGTGKLENFSSFFYGALLLPTAAFFIFCSIQRFLYPPAEIHFGYSQIPMIPNILRSVILLVWILRIIRRTRTPSPMLHSYFVNFKICLYNDIGVLIGLAAAYVAANAGHLPLSLAIDPILSFLVALYMLYNGIHLTVANFKSLADFPLPEEDQLVILKVLTEEFEHYENLGNIYTKQSGKVKIIEIELIFNKETTLDDVDSMRKRVKDKLAERFGELQFQLIPLRAE